MLRNIGAMGGGLAMVLLLAELCCRVLPVSGATFTGYYLDPMIVTYPPHHRWWTSSGWDLRNARQLRANNLGFVADIDFVPDPLAIGLIGDSYVEAGMLDPQDRPAARLAFALSATLTTVPRPVYALGGPGSALLDYAERIRFARQRLGVRDFVVLMEPGDLRQSLCGSGNVHAACLDPTSLAPRVEPLAPPSLAKRWLRHLALAQYLVGQLKIDPIRLVRQASGGLATKKDTSIDGTTIVMVGGASGPTTLQTEVVRVVSAEFFERLSKLDIHMPVFVLDGRRNPEALAQAPNKPPGVMQERDAFIAIASQYGAVVVDAEPVFRTHWAHSTLSLAVSPQDGHLNPLGVDLLMHATAQSLPRPEHALRP